jgi:hypothetical protein
VRLRPWTYLAVLAAIILWNMPAIVAWGLVALLAVDVLGAMFGGARAALHRIERDLRLDDPQPADRIVEAGGQRWRLSPAGLLTQICDHRGAVEVRRVPVPAVGITDEVVAHWCDQCKTQLPAAWSPPATKLTPTVVDTGIPAGAGYINAERRAALMRAFVKGATAGAPVWISEPVHMTSVGSVGTPCARCGRSWHPGECPEEIEAAGFHAVECPALGMPPTWVRGDRRPARQVTRCGPGYSIGGRYYETLTALAAHEDGTDPRD